MYEVVASFRRYDSDRLHRPVLLAAAKDLAAVLYSNGNFRRAFLAGVAFCHAGLPGRRNGSERRSVTRDGLAHGLAAWSAGLGQAKGGPPTGLSGVSA